MAERWGCARGTVSRWASRHDVTRHYNDPKELKRLYHEEDMSQRDIADHLGRHYITIQNKFKEFGIEVPDPRDPTRPMCHGFYRKHKDVVGSEYEVMATSVNGTHIRFRVHRRIALAHGILTFEEFLDPDTIVHHETEHGLDNRPESLRKMSRSEHMSHHWELRKR